MEALGSVGVEDLIGFYEWLRGFYATAKQLF